MNDAEDLRVVIPSEIVNKKTDGRGRLYLGSDYENRRVKVAVLEVGDEDTSD